MSNIAHLHDLLTAESIDILQKRIRLLASALGFHQFIYAQVVSKKIAAQGFIWRMNDYSPSWQARYQDMGYGDLDPVKAYCADGKQFTPLVWTDDIYVGAKQKNFQEDARSHGVGVGLSFPIFNGDGTRFAFNLSLSDNSRNALMLANQKLAEALLLATYVHEAARRMEFPIYNQDDSESIILSSREKECLIWGAAGKSAWETGQILHISEWTVVFHIENAKKKLGATKKQQAVARAIALGLIKP